MDDDATKPSNSFGGQTGLVRRLSIILFSPSNNSLKLNSSRANAKLHTLWFSERNWPCSCTKSLMGTRLCWPSAWDHIPIGCDSGASGGPGRASLWKIKKDAAASRFFPPLERSLVKAMACEMPRHHNQPLSRYSLSDLVRRLEQEPRVRRMSRSTVWKILHSDAIKPWQHRCWIFPRDPLFVEKARVVLDLSAGFGQGQPLSEEDHLISADEKTSLQARVRLAATLAPAPSQPMRYEHEYDRGGAIQYLTAWDVRGALPLGLCEAKTGIEPFHRLVDLVMKQAPYCKARRVFWMVEGGSSHRGEAFAHRLRGWYRNTLAVALPVHASWLNQIEIYFSIVQRKVLTPHDFIDLQEVRQRLMDFEVYYAQVAEPFDWRFTSEKLEEWYKRLQAWEKLRPVA
jgi:hypothetical protein